MDIRETTGARQKLRYQAELALGLIGADIDPVTPNPEMAGFAIATKNPSAIFEITTSTTNAIEGYKREHPGEDFEKATLHIGQPPTFKGLQEAQLGDLWGLSEGQKQPEFASRPVVGRVVDFIKDTVVPNMASYCKTGGSPEFRANVNSRFVDTQGNAAFAPNEMTVVSGGPENAVYFANELLRQSLPEGSSPLFFEVVDTRGGEVDWKKIVADIKAHYEDGNYINLIIQDSAQLTEEVRNSLRGAMGRGQVMVTDMVNGKFDGQKSLAMDPTFSGLVLTVDDSNTARATGASAVMGYHKIIASIEGLHTQRTGTPSSTQQDVAVLLSDSDFRQRIKELDYAEIGFLIDDSQADASDFLKKTLIYLKSTAEMIDGEAPSDLATVVASDAKVASKLEDRFDEVYGSQFPGQENAVSNGGGRWGLHQTFEHLKEKGADTIVVIPPRFKDKRGRVISGGYWTYGNVSAGMQVLALENCYDENGRLDQTKLDTELSQLAETGKKVVIVDQSGGHNPSGTVRSRREKEMILNAIAVQNETNAGHEISLVDDAAYLDLMFSNVSLEDRKTYAQIAQETQSKVGINTVLTGSKGPGQAGARYNTVYSKDAKLIGKIRQRRESQILNTLGMQIAHALLEPNKYQARLEMLVANVEDRVMEMNAQLVEDGRDIGGDYVPQGAFYPLAFDGWIGHGATKKERALLLAQQRCGVIPLAVLNGDPDVVRLAGGSNKSAEQLRREVKYFHEAEQLLMAA